MNLLNLPSITTAIAAGTVGQLITFKARPLALSLQAKFLYGSGGTTFDAYVQSTIDGVNWFDIANFHFLLAAAWFQYNLNAQTPITTERTPSNGSLAANTALDGIWGTQFRTIYQSTGTYAGATSLTVDMAVDLA